MSDYTGFREIGVNLDALVATVEIRAHRLTASL